MELNGVKLEAAANNLNQIFDPPIAIDTPEQMAADIRIVAMDFEPEDVEDINETTEMTLRSIGIDLPWEDRKPKDAPMSMVTAEIEAAKAANKPVVEEEPVVEPKTITVHESVIEEPIEEPIEVEKQRVLNEILDGKPVEKTKGITRIACYHAAIMDLCHDGATKKEIMDKSDEIYRKNGGTSKNKITNIASITIHTLVTFNAAKEIDGKIKLTK